MLPIALHRIVFTQRRPFAGVGHKGDSCYDGIRLVVALKRVAAATQHSNPVVCLQFLERKIDKIIHAQAIKPKAKVVEYLVNTAQARLAAYKPASQRPNPTVPWYPTVNLGRL